VSEATERVRKVLFVSAVMQSVTTPQHRVAKKGRRKTGTPASEKLSDAVKLSQKQQEAMGTMVVARERVYLTDTLFHCLTKTKQSKQAPET